LLKVLEAFLKQNAASARGLDQKNNELMAQTTEQHDAMMAQMAALMAQVAQQHDAMLGEQRAPRGQLDGYSTMECCYGVCGCASRVITNTVIPD
jgi:hypothetical protein